VPWHLQDMYDEEKQSSSIVDAKPEESQFIETAIKDKEKQATVYHRYYHVFREWELEGLVEDYFGGRLKIVDRFYDHANWVVVCEKIS